MIPPTDERVVTFHHVPVQEYTGIRLGPKEQVMSVEWDPDTEWFHILIMSEQSDGLVAAPRQQANQPPAHLPPEGGLTAEPDPDDPSHGSSVAHTDGDE